MNATIGRSVPAGLGAITITVGRPDNHQSVADAARLTAECVAQSSPEWRGWTPS